jgi:hypothetical protein
MRDVRLGQRAELKLAILESHGMAISVEFVLATIRSPDKLEPEEDGKLLAQKRLNENRVLRVVYREFAALYYGSLRCIPARGHDMKKISYSKDVDALLVELSQAPIAYAEAEGQVILHYSPDDKLVLVEILDFRRLMSDETVTALLAS